MFEFLNTGALGFLLFLSLVVIPIRKKASYLIVMLGFMFILLFYGAYASYSDAKNNRRYFSDGDMLKCLSGGGIYTSANQYSVSKAEGWILKKSYFVKDSLMLHADMCEKQEL